ncbi:MAG: hypothetical protein LLF87_05975 [Eubacteriales bacterium]|nr:hypothetical protein [Eubacteriales bacterium]
MDLVYHASPLSGLAKIEPRHSTHGESYVYAAKSRTLALVFSQKHDDYLFYIGYDDETGELCLTERIPGALEEVFRGKLGFLYALDATRFLSGKTPWAPELVSESAEPVTGCEEIRDCLAALLLCEARGELTVYRYPARPSCVPGDDGDLVEATAYFLKTAKDPQALVSYACEKHPHLASRLRALL